MKLRAIGCIELNSIAMGIYTADEMAKAADVQLVTARTICPGRYLVVVAGDTGAVQSSVDTGCKVAGPMQVDSFIIPNVHEDIVPAMSGTSICPPINALGIIETCTVASCIMAADAAAKSGQISLLEIRTAAGLAGKAFVLMTGDVGSVQSSVQAGLAGVGDAGPVLAQVVIPSPSSSLKEHLF